MSAPTHRRPMLRVVTAEGGILVPRVVLDRIAADALTAEQARLASYVPLVAEIEDSEGLAKSDAAARLALALLTRTAIPAGRPSAIRAQRPNGGAA